MKTIITVLMAGLFLVGCGASGPAADKTQALIEKAKAQRVIASKAHVEFRDTKKFIKQAEKALKDGKLQLAYDKANRAYTGSVRAIKQKEIAETTYLMAVPK